MKVFTATFLITLIMSTTAFAQRESITLGRFEVKNLYAILELTDSNEIADCRKDSDCGTGEICVGIGICVPKASAFEYRSELPRLMKRVVPRR
ncbi:MAG: hypothetical protein ISR65_19165 [Bacteriovoracaceae bacterium]|nr:hypothetical protein [Bacteriovoracaceae bacterium]